MPDLDKPSPRWPARTWSSIRSELNFFRIHLIYFTVTPLVFSGVFYASNGRYHIAYIDALFNCFSAMCCCGLATVNYSSLTPWQQVILLIQMCIGNQVFVSWFMVLVRRHYIARKFQHILASEVTRKYLSSPPQGTSEQEQPRSWSNRMVGLFRSRKGLSVVHEEKSEGSKSPRHGIIRKLRPDMIRRMDDAPMPVNPSGWVTEAPSLRSQGSGTGDRIVNDIGSCSHPHGASEPKRSRESLENLPDPSTPGSTDERRRHRLSDPYMPPGPAAPKDSIHRYQTMMDGPTNEKQGGFPRQQTIEFAPTLQRPQARPEQPAIHSSEPELSSMNQQDPSDLRSIRRPSLGPYNTINTMHTVQTQRTMRAARSAKHRDYGGFPMPHRLISSVIHKMFPKFKRKFTRTVTIPATTSLVSTHGGQLAPPHAKAVPYISFNAIVGRNSAFHHLTNEQLEELGGVEYRALNVLLWLVAGYFFGLQLISYIVIAPYMSTSRWSENFQPPNLIRPVAPGWFALFQVVSGFSNTGSSLVDESMIPFQKAYAMVVFLMVLILFGNCAYPILLRLIIWVTTKIIPHNSRLNETLHFLLDHPRRCYTYLFPSHQTWFLLTIVFVLTALDWLCFMILDIGNSVIEQISLNTRVLAGLFQAVAVRAAGFAIVPMNSVAPSVKVLYMVMMYISVYPIALSIRSSNVYEEQSLGIFDHHDDLNEENFETTGPSRVNVWSRYLAMHVRRQLAFDMWWLAIAVFLICIIERHHLEDPNITDYFNVFNIMFEIASAYGTVGLSLGITGQNFSLSGAFRPLSKLVVIAVILRGRHRGLPVAIDRAILLPSELDNDREAEEIETRSHHTQGSRGQGTGYAQYSKTEATRSGDEGSEKPFQRRIARRGTFSASSDYEQPAPSVHEGIKGKEPN